MPLRSKSKRTASLPVAIKDHKQVATRPVMLLVLGPHRSGTSLTARMLECLGAENSQHQLPPQPDNPTGFFEDSDVYAFGESVLLPKIQRRWESVSPTDWSVLSKTDRSRLGLQALEIIRKNYPLSNPLSVLKEPRINNTLPFWLSLLEHAGFDVRVVCVVRDPVSTARSFTKRNNFSLAHGGMVYLTAWLSVLPHLQERQVSFVQFDEIFATPGKVLGKVADKLGLPLPGDFDQRVHTFTSAHLDPALRHSTLPREDVMLEPDLPSLVAELYRVLLDAAQSQNIRKTAKFAAHAERQIECLAPLLADYDAKQIKLSSLQTEYDNAKSECAHLQSQLTDSSHQSHAAITAERDAVFAERETLRSRISALEAEHAELSTRHSSLVAERDVLSFDHSSLSILHSSLVAERDDLAARQSALTARLAAAEQERETSLVRLEQLERCLEDLTARNRLLVEERATLADERKHLLAQAEQERAEREAQAARLIETQADRQELSTRHSALQSAHDEMAARAAELDNLRNELIAWKAVQSETQAKLTTAEQALLEARSAREKTEADAKDTAEENELLLSQLHQVQEELEIYFLENRELKQQHDHLTARISTVGAEQLELATRHTSLVTALEELKGQHSSLIAERDDLATHHWSLLIEREALQSAHATLTNSLDSVQSMASRLEENVATRYRELAILAREIADKDKALKNAEDKAIYRGANSCQIASIELMDSVERPPHNHLNVLLRHLQVGQTVWPWVRIRLVEHHGRPGLVVFESPGEAVPLQHWTRSAEENGIPFFLMVPEDESGKEFFLQAPPTDIYSIYFLAKSLESELHKAAQKSHHPVLGSDSLHAWAQIATSMRKLLEIECSRFRHGAFTALAVSLEKNTELIKVDLSDCLYGGRFLPRISFTWDVAAESLNFERGENLTLPFLGWPMTRNGSAVESVDASFLRKPLKDRAFRQGPLGSHDEGFVLALAQSLPSLLVGSSVEASLAKARKFVSHVQRAACVQITSRKN